MAKKIIYFKIGLTCCFVFFSSCLIACGGEVNGTNSECVTFGNCRKTELCSDDECKCLAGYVKVNEKCFEIKKYGQQCHYDIQCNDYRMICTNEDNDVQQKTFCYCDPYHLWDSTVRECLDIGNITQAAGNFREVHNVTGVLEKSAQKVFLGVVVAGLISVCVLLSFVAICSVYGCCVRHKKGRYGDNNTKRSQINEVAVIGLPTGTYEAIETDFSAIAV